MDCCKRGKDTGQDRQARRTIIGNYRRLREFVWVGGCVTTPAMWASPPGRRTQECTQIGGNGLSGPFWGICVHCCAVGLGCGWPWDRNSVHKWEDRASPRRIGAFVYTVATRVAIRICDASCVRWHEHLSHHGVPAAPPRWPLSLGRKDGLCASGAAARLASSPRRQPTRTPEESIIAPHNREPGALICR